MSKETSTILKGVAILMMLWYHLFGISDLDSVCSPLIYIHGKALAAYMANATYPVTFFLILSGYGLTYVYRHQQLNAKSQSKRLLKLYIHYWIVLVVFVTIGHFIDSETYPHDWVHVLTNIIGIRCTYNGETWFLLPYAVITLFSYHIIHYVYHLKGRIKIGLTCFIYLIIFLSARYLGNHLPEDVILNTLLIQPVYWVILTFYFSLGIFLYRLLETNHRFTTVKPMVYLLLMIGLFIVKCLFKVTLADGLYALAFTWCFIHIPLHPTIKKLLHEIGRRSMVMWMTHTFFCVYLFQDFIYGFQYPVVIFLVLVLVSYLTSVILMWIARKVISITNVEASGKE